MDMVRLKDTSKWLRDEINHIDKLYLLHGRKEPQENKPPTQVVLCMRQCTYIGTSNSPHPTLAARSSSGIGKDQMVRIWY